MEIEALSRHTDDRDQISVLCRVLGGICSPVSLAQLQGMIRSTGLRSHLAVLNEPYLSRILSGKKMMESRFSRVRTPPYHHVTEGDFVLLKASSGSVIGVAEVAGVEFFETMTPRDVYELMDRYKDVLALDASFQESKADARYATLIALGMIEEIPPLHVTKRDRRGWVVLTDQQKELF